MPSYVEWGHKGLLRDKGLGAFEPKAKKASRGGGPSDRLCLRRGREWPSQLIEKSFLFRCGKNVIEGTILRRNLGG